MVQVFGEDVYSYAFPNLDNVLICLLLQNF